MNSIVGDKYIAELVQIFEQQGSALYAGQHSLCLTVPCLHYIQRKLSTIHEGTGNPLPAQFAHLQQLQESFGRILILKLISDRNYQLSPTATLSLEPFRAVHSLILKKVPVSILTGLSRLRSQLRSLVLQRCGVATMEEVIVRCGADDSASFSWASLREVDFSHNSISQLGDSLQYLTAIEKVDLSNNVMGDETMGVELIDGVTYLHLGFNQLKTVPRFGPRAKFNLTGLNLRNNRLATIEGVQDLDSLTDLDLTDNLLTRHSDLQPLRNLHNLSLLSLIGNPLSFHPKHRVKSVESLSNLINPTSFRLDGKKLSSSEKKAVPRSLTHYPGSSPSISSQTTSESPLHTHNHTLTPPPSSHLMNRDSPAHQSDAAIIAKRRRSKKTPAMRVVTLHDSDEEQDSLNDTGSGTIGSETASSVPLKYEKRLQKMKDLAKQMPDKWLLSNASLDTTSSESNQKARGASQPRAALEHPPLGPAAMETVGKATGDGGTRGGTGSGSKRKVKKKTNLADAATVEEPRTSTPIIMSEIDGVSGECFLVERYESDVEEGGEEGEGEQVLLTLSDRFLEEKDINGKVLDRMDLGCLMTAEMRTIPWKSSQQAEVVTLQFSHERRDRRKREYVMIELNHEAIIEILAPISEENQKAFSLASKVECFTCQRVFDATESMLMPLLSGQSSPPLPHSHPHILGHHQRPSLTDRFCPFCKSQQLQYVTNTPDFKHDSSTLSSSASPRVILSHSKNPATTSNMDGGGQGSVTLGFVVSKDTQLLKPPTDSELAPNRRERSSAFVEESEGGRGGWDDLERAHSYDTAPTNPQPQNDVVSHSETTSDLREGESDQQYISSWSFSELSVNPAPQNYLRTSHDVLYHSKDQVGVEYPRRDSGDMEDSSISYSQDTSDFRRAAKNTMQPEHGTRNRPKQKYNTIQNGVGRNSTAMSDLSHSGGNKSSRLTNSDPSPKLQPYSDGNEGRGTTNTPGGELRRFSTPDRSRFQPRNPFDDQGSPYGQLCSDSAASRMKIPRASLGSVQEQPASTSLNPFDESYCSTNPFDMEDSTTSNPFGAEDEEEDETSVMERVKEEDVLSPITPTGRGRGFSHKEEKYFPQFQSRRKKPIGHSKDDADFDFPPLTRYHIPPPSSSVPASSFMQAFAHRPSSGRASQDYPVVSKKSSTLPYSRSPRLTQESPELSKRTRTTLPLGKPPIPGMLVRGKSMESLDRSSPRNEHHPIKSNRIMSPHSKRRWNDPYGDDHLDGVSGGKGSSRGSDSGGKGRRNGSMSPSANNGSSGSGKSTPEVTRRDHSSSDSQKNSRGGRRKLNRVTSVGDLRFTTDNGSSDRGGGRVSGSLERGRGRSSADESRTSSRGSSHRGESGGGSSSGGGGTRGKISSGSSESHRKLQKLSSSESSGRPLSSSVLIKDEDPSYIHNSLNLHLDLEVFSKEKGEHFKMTFKAPMVKYKSRNEVPVVAIFSNLNTFIYRITAPQSTQPDKWLSLQQTLPLSKLVYLDVGPFHQFLRLEFSVPESCFTFLLRDKNKCRECLTRLSMIVSDTPKSSFKSVGICPFRLETISYPDRALREAIMSRYNNIKTASPRSREIREERRGRESDDDDIKLYVLVHRHILTPGKKHSKVPVTVVVAGDVIYLAQENFHHWPLPRLQELPPKEALDPPFSSVEQKDITDIEQITMDPDQTCRVVLRFFKETLSEGESKYWSLTTEVDTHVQQLVKAIQAPWESMFETTLPINYK